MTNVAKGYESIDKLQNLLADNVFGYTTDKKKAAGRALGTFLEIIAYYLLKTWGLDRFAAIEKPLPEFANNDITHNVEFTLHGSREIGTVSYGNGDFPLSGTSILKKLGFAAGGAKRKSVVLVDKNRVIRNACTLASTEEGFVNAYVDADTNQCAVHSLLSHPFAMFECKRVGVEEGAKKGPQTIEKAKQGSYVARTVSSLQRIRMADGSLAGFLQLPGGQHLVGDYYALLAKVISSDDADLLRHFILTIGVVSNHGNWFTSDNPNKELKVLAQSYDWLLFLTDQGLSEFITDLLVAPAPPYTAAREAFLKSYSPGKTGNVFTKVRMDYASDLALRSYFACNRARIEGWFNVISPKGKSLAVLKRNLACLAGKNWEAIHGHP